MASMRSLVGETPMAPEGQQVRLDDQTKSLTLLIERNQESVELANQR